MSSAGGTFGPAGADASGGPGGPADAFSGPGGPGLPRLPGFREMALRRMAGERRRLVGELTAHRQAAGLSQTQVAARMGTSQSAVARIEAGAGDVRATTLERYAAAVGSHISWRLLDSPPAGQAPPSGPVLGSGALPGPGPLSAGGPGEPSPPGHFGSPALRPAAGPLAPAAQYQSHGPRQEDPHDRSRG